MPGPPRPTSARPKSVVGVARATASRRGRAAPKPTVVFLVRHGLTPTTGKVLPGRAPGLHLSDVGRAQAERAAERLAALSTAPSAVYSSPMERTRETAAPIAKALGLRVRTQAGLLDAAVGAWQGKSLKVLSKKPEWRTVVGWKTGFRFPGGESFNEMASRVVATVLGLAEEHKGERIVCVSHADPIQMVIAAMAGVPLDMAGRVAISPASISALALGAGPPVVLCVNSTGLLSELVRS
ncbi:MAG: histidine phosphatase family protein [Acidimicrobiales bacterium]